MKTINFPERNITVHFIDPKDSLKPGKNIIRKQFQVAITAILEKYDLRNVAYVVFDAHPSYTIPPLGFGAYTTNENVIIVNIDPTFSGFPPSLKDELIHMIGHESAHIIRMRQGQLVHNLFDALISEGLADYFGEEICQSNTTLWHQKHYAKSKIPYNLAKKEMKKKQDIGTIYQDWFTMGNPKRGIPWTAGYALGKQIVEEYLKDHPKTLPSQILGLSSDVFLSSFNKVHAAHQE